MEKRNSHVCLPVVIIGRNAQNLEVYSIELNLEDTYKGE